MNNPAVRTTTHESSVAPVTYDMGVANHALPIAEQLPSIMDTIVTNRVTITTSPTGTGKSTQIPKFALGAQRINERGEAVPFFDEIITTETRRIAARQLRERVVEELDESYQGVESSKLVGYQTGFDRDLDPANRAIVMTGGIATLRLMDYKPDGRRRLLVFDEVHEWDMPTDLNIALVKEAIIADPDLHVVLLSATIDASGLSHHFSDVCGKPAPVIELTNPMFPVEYRQGSEFYQDVSYYHRKGGVLGFLPGKPEIMTGDGILREMSEEEPLILHLHGEQTPLEQSEALALHEKDKIVLSTNIGATSLTPLGITTVVDSGVERRSVIRSGVEVLEYQRASKARQVQAAGRIGRLAGGGVYSVSPLSGYKAVVQRQAEQPEYDQPAIQRSFLDTDMLRLLSKGYDMELLDFYHAPAYESIMEAKLRLRRLGALALDSSEMTSIGRAMAELPLSASHARMVVEASHIGDEKLTAMMLAATAVQEAKGIVIRDTEYVEEDSLDWKNFSDELRSNVLQELDVFCELRTQQLTSHAIAKLGVGVRKYREAQLLYEKLCETTGISPHALTKPTLEQRTQLYQAIITGSVDGVFVKNSEGTYSRGRHKFTPESEGVISAYAKLVVGRAFGVEVMKKDGTIQTRWMINGATEVSPGELAQAVPARISERHKGFSHDHNGNTYDVIRLFVDGESTQTDLRRPVAHTSPELRRHLINESIQTGELRTIVDTLRDLQSRLQTPINIGKYEERLVDIASEALPHYVLSSRMFEQSVAQLIEDKRLSIRTLVREDEIDIDTIYALTPDTCEIGSAVYPVTYRGGAAHIERANPHHRQAITHFFDALGTPVVVESNDGDERTKQRKSRRGSRRR